MPVILFSFWDTMYIYLEIGKINSEKEVDKIYKNFEKIHTGEILDNLGLKRYCCRRNLIANIDMMDVI
jgi:DNA-directed RNA polymerase subunit N (RpoN/RPB10)